MGKKIEGVDVLDVEKRRVPSKHYVSFMLAVCLYCVGLQSSVNERFFN